MVQKIKATNGASNPQIDSAVVGIQTRTPLSNMALLTLLGRMDCGDTTCRTATFYWEHSSARGAAGRVVPLDAIRAGEGGGAANRPPE
jgi:hypothetical protein